ncbi:MAG: hypothetical protein JNM60_09635 [Candidatus Competibacteraceae bacterium]|nr:hypothetical protein [Candidatus Competibacteraceae bacterium]
MIGWIAGVAWRLVGGKGHERDFRKLERAGRSAAANLLARAPAEPLADFEACVRAYGLDDRGLRRLHRRHARQFYFFAGGGLFAATFGATAAFQQSEALGLLAVLLALLFWAVATRHALRAWQIRERRLGGYGEWLRRPGTWFPPLFFSRKP